MLAPEPAASCPAPGSTHGPQRERGDGWKRNATSSEPRWPTPAAAPIAAPEAAPICHRQGRVERDHMGSCRPRGPTPPRRSHRAQFGSLSLSRRPSTGSNRQRQRIYRTLSLDESSASALRARRACSGRSRNPLAGPVRADLVETVIPVRVGYGSPAGLRMVYRPSDLALGSGYTPGRGQHPPDRDIAAGEY